MLKRSFVICKVDADVSKERTLFLHFDFKPEDGGMCSSEALRPTYQTTTMYHNPEDYNMNYLIWFYVSFVLYNCN